MDSTSTEQADVSPSRCAPAPSPHAAFTLREARERLVELGLVEVRPETERTVRKPVDKVIAPVLTLHSLQNIN
jgi:hypothetical protein